MTIDVLALFVRIFFDLLEWCILIQVVYSWVRPHSKSYFYLLITSIVVPVYRPIRRIVPPFGTLDLTPLFALLLVDVIAYLILNFLVQFV